MPGRSGVRRIPETGRTRRSERGPKPASHLSAGETASTPYPPWSFGGSVRASRSRWATNGRAVSASRVAA